MASYNCTGSSDTSYGGGDYGTCTGQSVGAPNTGVFGQTIDSAGFTIIAPLVAAIVVVIIASATMKFRKKQNL